LPLFARDRENENFPLLMAGGIAPTLNPEPFAPLFDLLFVGEAESFVHDFVRVFLEKSRKHKEELLTELSQLEGVYIPRFYSVEYDHRGGRRSLVAKDKAPERVKRVLDSDLEKHPAYSPVISSLSHFKNTFLIEIGRGCPHPQGWPGWHSSLRLPRARDSLQRCRQKGVRPGIVLLQSRQGYPRDH